VCVLSKTKGANILIANKNITFVILKYSTSSCPCVFDCLLDTNRKQQQQETKTNKQNNKQNNKTTNNKTIKTYH
jgi:hypothetical protein